VNNKVILTNILEFPERRRCRSGLI